MKKSQLSIFLTKFLEKMKGSVMLKSVKILGSISHPNLQTAKKNIYFCLAHVKEYNKRWNFFAGKTQTQIYDYQKMIFYWSSN